MDYGKLSILESEFNNQNNLVFNLQTTPFTQLQRTGTVSVVHEID